MGGVEGRGKWMIGVVYVNRRGVRVEGKVFEVVQVGVMKYEVKGFDVVMGECMIWEHKITLNSNGKRLLDLVRLGNFVVGSKLQCCVGCWTWVSW